jgi:hypothetical protein
MDQLFEMDYSAVFVLSDFLIITGKASPANKKIPPVNTKTAVKLKVVIINPPAIGPKILPKKVVRFAIPKTLPRS